MAWINYSLQPASNTTEYYKQFNLILQLFMFSAADLFDGSASIYKNMNIYLLLAYIEMCVMYLSFTIFNIDIC